MQLLKNDGTVLQFSRKPPNLGTDLFFLGGALGIGLLLISFLDLTSTLQCDRNPSSVPTCERITSHLIFPKSKRRSLPQLRQAQLKESVSDEGDFSYTVLLLTVAGQYSLSNNYANSKSEAQQAVHQINTYLRSSTAQSLTIFQNNTGKVYGLVIFLTIVLLSMFLFRALRTVQVQWIFDRVTNQVTIKRQGYFKSDSQQHLLSSIRDVKVHCEEDAMGGRHYSIQLIAEEGTPISLWIRGAKAAHVEAADLIQAFLTT